MGVTRITTTRAVVVVTLFGLGVSAFSFAIGYGVRTGRAWLAALGGAGAVAAYVGQQWFLYVARSRR